MQDLTPRQIEILKKIIEEYINTAQPVGSETLEKRYDLGVSPATIRNEMSMMIKLGYLSKPHSSSGRIPTSKALKFYIGQLMKEKDLTVAEEVQAKENVWDYREDEIKFLREMTKSLASKTKALAVTTTSRGDVFLSGYANILEMPEFYDIDITKNLLTILDDYRYLDSIVKRLENEFSVFLGEELQEELLRPYCFIFAKFNTRQNHQGTIGIVGPMRLRYEIIVPMVRYFGDLVGEVAEW